MPWPNWNCDPSPPCPAGWLYKGDCNTPVNLTTGNPANDAQNWYQSRAQDLVGGVYWQYIPNQDAFMCPVDALSVGKPANDPGSHWDSRNNKLSTYVMNGASAFFPPSTGIGAAAFNYQTCKASQIWSPLCIIQWEPDSSTTTGTGSYVYNDGSDKPQTSEGIGRLHIKGANVLAVGGNANMMSYQDYIGEMNHNLAGVKNLGKGLLYWNTKTADGYP
jgi:hypothetical protein